MLDDLKNATLIAHQKAEENNMARYIIDHSITTPSYIALIVHNYQVYHAVEKFADVHKKILPEEIKKLLTFEKSNRLLKDLEEYGQDKKDISAITIPIIPTPASIIGSLYVIEGSMMGGILIARHLQHCEQLTYKKSHFYSGEPKQHLQRWEQFKDGVNSQSFSEKQVQEAVLSANITFDLF